MSSAEAFRRDARPTNDSRRTALLLPLPFDRFDDSTRSTSCAILGDVMVATRRRDLHVALCAIGSRLVDAISDRTGRVAPSRQPSSRLRTNSHSKLRS